MYKYLNIYIYSYAVNLTWLNYSFEAACGIADPGACVTDHVTGTAIVSATGGVSDA